jgi:hypothetical protein
VRVEPGIARRENGQVDAVGGDGRKFRGQRRRREQLHVDTHALLEFEVLLHLRGAAGVGDEQVPLAAEADVDGLFAHRHGGREIPVELEAKGPHQDVLRQAEQAADAAVRARRRGVLVSRVTLDDEHIAGVARSRQVVGDAAADDAASDDDDIRLFLTCCHERLPVARFSAA